MQAMLTAYVSRIFCTSAGGLEPGPLGQRWLAAPLLWLIFKNMYIDLVRMEAALKGSDLNWTILRPAALTNGQRTGHYQAAVGRHLSSGFSITRADVADYIIQHLKDHEIYCSTVELAY